MTDPFTAPAAASSVLGFVTTIHLGLTALRNHRRQPGAAGILLAAVSLCFVATPWLMPSLAGVAIGLIAHAAWFAACERLAGTDDRERHAASGARAATGTRAPGPPRASASTRQFTEVTVLAVVDETPDIRTIRLARPAGLTFRPGQFMTVRLQAGGREATRCYSISSSPEATAYLEISVRRQGVVSGALHTSMRPGATLQVMGPLGAFVYPADDDRPLVLIAGGVGITPVASMIRHALATEPTRPVTLVYSARNDREFAFRDEWLSLAKRHAQFQAYFASSATEDPSVYPGRVDRALLEAAAPRLAQSVVCMCGPQPMLEALRTLLAELGVPDGQIRYELFEAAVAAATGGAAGMAARRAGQARGRHTMTCVASRKAVPIESGQTLLEAAEQADVDLPSLCRAGICGTCRVRVVDGDVQCSSATLDADDLRAGYVLACVSTTDTDCSVQL